MAALAAIGIVTKDMAEAVRFYRLLGIDVPAPHDDHLEAQLPNGLRLMWDTVELMESIDPERESPVGNRMALAFECESPTEVDAVFELIVSAGFRSKKQPWDAFWGQRYAEVLDPDDNVVDLFASLDA